MGNPGKLADLADPASWGTAAAFEQFRAAAVRRAAELRRTTGERHTPPFGRWLKLASPEWPWHYRHLKVIRQYLKRVEAGEVTRLMIFLHPRSFQRQMVDEWLTAAGGGLKAVGVGSGVTGRGASLLLIDDPVQSYEQARSHAYQQRLWTWWDYDLKSRLEPHPRDGRPPAVILIMTRWSENDLAGRLLAAEGGDEWTVLRIPALAETQDERDDYNAGVGRPTGEPDPLGRESGEAMNPERFDAAALEAKRSEGLLSFMALYQQRPSVPEGDMFRREWFEVVDQVPPGRRVAAVRYWDKAGSKGRDSAYSAGVLTVKVDDTFHIAHMVMGKWQAAEREAVIDQTAAADFSAYGYEVEQVVEQEPGSGGKESAENTVGRLAAAGYRAAADRPTGDKTLRAEPLAAAASVGRVKIVAGTWNRDYLDILAAFPGGAIKDAVDASSGGYARLARAEAARPQAGRAEVVRAEDIFEY